MTYIILFFQIETLFMSIKMRILIRLNDTHIIFSVLQVNIFLRSSVSDGRPYSDSTVYY